MIDITAPTTLELTNYLLDDIFTGRMVPDDVKADRMYFYDLNLTVTNPLNDLDLRLVQWQQKRWRKFGQEYMGEDWMLNDWLHRCISKEDGASDWAEIGFDFQRAGGSRGHRLLGNCLWGMSFHRRPFPRVTILSRVTNFLPVAFLEMSLANLVCQYLSEQLEQPVQFQWYVTQLQFSIQWSFPYWYHVWMPEAKKKHLSFSKHVKLWTNRLSKRYKAMASGEVESYPYKRETNLYLRTQKEFPSYYPRLEDLYE